MVQYKKQSRQTVVVTIGPGRLLGITGVLTTCLNWFIYSLYHIASHNKESSNKIK